MSDLTLPNDFVWVEPLDKFDHSTVVIKHKVSRPQKHVAISAYLPKEQSEVDFLVTKVRREHRRDRLFRAVGKDLGRFRACQAEMRRRGYLI